VWGGAECSTLLPWWKDLWNHLALELRCGLPAIATHKPPVWTTGTPAKKKEKHKHTHTHTQSKAKILQKPIHVFHQIIIFLEVQRIVYSGWVVIRVLWPRAAFWLLLQLLLQQPMMQVGLLFFQGVWNWEFLRCKRGGDIAAAAVVVVGIQWNRIYWLLLVSDWLDSLIGRGGLLFGSLSLPCLLAESQF